MEHKNDGPLAGSPATKGPRLRRKLQKCVSRQQSSISRRFGSSASRHGTPSENKGTPPPAPAPPPPAPQLRPFPAPVETQRDTPPARSVRFYERDPPFGPLEHLENRAYVVPEFSHLVARTPPRRPSFGSDSPPHSAPIMRRRAKTPIFSIGQLEGFSPPNSAGGRTSSVDLIAEQYQAVLESRGSSVYSDNYSEPALSPPPSDDDEPPTLSRRRRSVSCLQCEPHLRSTARMAEAPDPSPVSEDGTLVSFQDETVYFKPVSFSPGPESPTPTWGRGDSGPGAAEETPLDDNVSLQICLDLLTRELSAALAGRPCRPAGMGTSALQVWAMIEAYERLRDQMAELSASNAQARALEGMFDLWLRALASIHESMTGSGGGGGHDTGPEMGAEELD
ncbi:hypothetical protein C8A05DRAFT_33740 [Staphylotrichum tortipilum]|uniref:Uncharacterized protein n=1 Tax=Staphylotrichum tortipilum TaxID=2831512 RepID=A0AAN6MMA2_9PEZI|nr:hypothetical protein C8A05DRAFT_33740 [Staphylotrichum longicolle]